MASFAFLVPDGGQPPGVLAAARGADSLVRVAAGHPLLQLGAPYFRVGGAAAPAGPAPILDCIRLADLEGFLCDAVALPDVPGDELFGLAAFAPPFLERVVNRALVGVAVVDVRSLVDAVMALARSGGVQYDPAVDLVRLEPFALPGPAGEQPNRPASWHSSFALANVPFSAFADDSGLFGAYSSLRRAVGVPGVAVLRRSDPFASVSRFLHGLAPRVDVSVSDITWASDRLSAAVHWLASSKWPDTLVLYDVYCNPSRAAADLSARASFFVGDAAMRTRVLRQRFPSFFLRFATLSRLFANAPPSELWDLAVTLAQRIEPNCDLSSVHLWARIERTLVDCSNVLLEAGGVDDARDGVARFIAFLDARGSHSSSGLSAGANLGGAPTAPGSRSRATATVDVLSSPAVAGPDGLVARLRVAASVSKAEVLTVALSSQLQPVVKFVFDDKHKAPLEHEIFTILGRARLAAREYLSLQVSIGDDGGVHGPAEESNLSRATKFQLSQPFFDSLTKGNWAAVLDSVIPEYRRWHSDFCVACPPIVDVISALPSHPDLVLFLDRLFSGLAYPRRSMLGPPPPVDDEHTRDFTLGGVLDKAVAHIRRSPAPGYHDNSARSFVYDVVALSSIDYKHFIGDAVCSAELPAFATSDSQPFKQIAQTGSVGDEIRKMSDYAPALVAHALSVAPAVVPTSGPSASPSKRNKPTTCALPGCNNTVYPGMDYCGASHAVAAGALHPGSASWNPVPHAPFLPAAAPFGSAFGFPPPFPAPPFGNSAPFAPSTLGVAPPPGPPSLVPAFQSPGAFAFPGLPPAASPFHGVSPLGGGGRGAGKGGGRGKGGKGGGDGRGRGRGKGGKGSYSRGGGRGFADTCRQMHSSSAGPTKGSLAQQFMQHSATHVGVQFGSDGPTVIDKAKAGSFCGCGPDDKCWGTLMCMSARDRLALCEHPQHHADNATEHLVPPGFHDAMKRGDFR